MSILQKPYFQARKNNGVLFEPDANTVLWLPGQDDAHSATIRDRSGNGNDGTIEGATWKRLGSGLWYLYYDGTDDYIDVDDASSLDFTDAITVKAWIRTSTTDIGRIMTKRNGIGDPAHFFFTEDATTGFLTFGFYNTNYKAVTGDQDMGDGIWHHVVGTYDKVNLTIYLDGVEHVTTTDHTAALVANNNKLTIGAGESGTGGNDWTGDIALPLARSTAWSATAVAGNYNEERHRLEV